MHKNYVTLYLDKGLDRVPPAKMMERLSANGRFSMFLEFVDPISNTLVQGHFPFYPKAVKYPGGGYDFLTRHRDMLIRIPADPWWWMDRQESGVSAEVTQSTTCLHLGEVTQIKFTVTVVKNAIRLMETTTWNRLCAEQTG